MRDKHTVLIVHTYGLEGSGSSTYTRGLADGLLDAGCEVVVACFRHRGDEGAVSRLRGRGATVEELPLRALALCHPRAEFDGAPLVSKLGLVELAERRDAIEAALAEITARHLPDMIIANHFLITAAAAVRVADSWRIPIAVVSHGTDVEYGAASSEPVRSLARETFAGASVRVALTHTARERLAEVLGVSLDAMVQIPPGICQDCDRPVMPGLRPPHVAFVGRMMLHKGPHLVIAAMADALAEIPDLHVTFIGDGPDRAALEALVVALDEGNELGTYRALADLGTTPDRKQMVAPVQRALFEDERRRRLLVGNLASRVSFSGYVSTRVVGDILTDVRLLVLPSMVTECLPLVLLEGMSSGTAIAATPLGGTVDLLTDVTDEVAPLAEFACLDPTRLVDTIAHALIEGTQSWTPRLGTTLSLYAQSRYRWSAIGERILSAIAASVAALTQPPRARVHRTGEGEHEEPARA